MTHQILHFSIEHLHGPEEIPYGEDELVVVCNVRDGRPYVKSFVEHYFSLGVKHIVFLDNDSSDGTVPAVHRYDNVTVLWTKLPYKEYMYAMRQYLIARFGKDRWCLCVDIDELFDYPYSDVMGLDSLLRYLNSKSYTAVTAQMLDMFADKPLSDRVGNLDEALKELHRFYDISRISRRNTKRHPWFRNNTLENDEIERFSGGIREIIFGTTPTLTKYPLVFSDGRIKPFDGSGHWVDNGKIADFTCVLYHYKFLDEYFRKQVAQVLRDDWDKFSEYKRYSKVLDRNPSLQVKQETSKEIKGVNDLLESRFLVVSDDYVSWVNAEEKESVL
jgi:hypothetical protein